MEARKPDAFDQAVSEAVDQRTAEWHQQRLGKLTMSRAGDFMQKGRSKDVDYGVRAQDYIYEKVAEILTESPHMISSAATAWGTDFEAEAIFRYQELTGNKVKAAGFVEYIKGIAGGSPDGLIGTDGMLEVKCPYNPATHVKTLLENQITDDKHFMQVQGNLMVTERLWCDYVSYDPRVTEESLQTVIIPFDRDVEVIRAIDQRIYQVWEKVQELIEKLK
jgi:hypothetical protein